ncbi:MAG: ZIP family metal transporter [Croceimicrobium sp.]|nr:ZIP family metal transporter [Bacteroidota bacterium]
MSTYIYLFVTVFVGALLGRWLRQSKSISLKILLIFSGAYLLGIGVFHLLPEVFETHSHHYGLLIMAGFFVQLLLEALSKGLEHGHSHSELFHNKGLPIGVMIGLFLHAFIESIPVGSHTDHLSREALFWGLIVHKLPVSIILYNMLCEFSGKWQVVWFWLFCFALMAPLGVVLGEGLDFFAEHSAELTAFVFGIFLHISTTILFEGNQSHRFNFLKYAVILLALAIAWLSVSH